MLYFKKISKIKRRDFHFKHNKKTPINRAIRPLSAFFDVGILIVIPKLFYC